MMCERQVSSGCEHLKKYKDENGTSIFEDIAGNFVYPHLKENFYELMKTMTLRCNAEKCTSVCLLHTCLFCTTVLCYETHLRQHVQVTGHKFAIDNAYGNVYCFICNNYVYDDEFLTIVDSVKQFSCSSLGFSYTVLTDVPLCKSDINLIVTTDINEPITRLKSTRYIGIRGLVNHGKTCFMNVALQAFAHVPLIRNYFLSNIHKCKLDQNCILCEMEILFNEFYNGKVEPIVLGGMVGLLWARVPLLAEDAQHDSHEFFIAAINLFHEDCSESIDDAMNCTCVSHKLFMGQLQSSLACSKCNNVSTAIDPFWDISLDIYRPIENDPHPLSLEECLEQYTQPEPLDTQCNNCEEEGNNPTKQMTFLKLPHILFLHLKRFRTVKKKKNVLIRKKISTKVTFPLVLDLTKFRSDYNGEDEGVVPNELNLDDNRYELCSIINHIGPSLDVGHYTTYISQNQHWFMCDDTKIKPVSLTQALNSEAYMLVYEKKTLEYS